MNSIKNRRAWHDYEIIQKFEAGIVLKGTEIKSIRDGKLNFKDSHARIVNDECWLLNLHIAPWEKSSYFNHEAERKRKLLMHSYEIKRLRTKVDELGMTIIPLEVYINDKGLCKVIVGLAKGKHSYDKRESLQRKDMQRDRERSESASR